MPSTISQMRNGQIPQQQIQQPRFQLNEEYINQLKTLMHSGNSMEFIMEAAGINPQLKQALSIARNGGNLQAFYESLARSMGADPNQIVNKLMS